MSDVAILVLGVVILAIVGTLVMLIRRGTTGKYLDALRGSETAAAALGISPARSRVIAFALSAAYMLACAGAPDWPVMSRLAAGGFRDMTRIASSPYPVWRDILLTNKDLISEVAGRFLECCRATAQGLEDSALQAAFEGAAKTRAEIPRDSKGFLHRLWDALVVVEDRPGTIAGIALPLAEKGINIQDIEVLKVREGEGGTLRLAFASQAIALEAIQILEEKGYKARLRE